MIYPPIGELIKKTGNRYSLVVAVAKRAREIAQSEKTVEKEKPGEMSVLEMRIKERMEKKPSKKVLKPIIKALDELINDEIIVLNKNEIYNADESQNNVKAFPSDRDVMAIEDNTENVFIDDYNTEY